MIHIDYPNGKKPDDAWLEKAKTLTESLKSAPDKAARDKIIDDNSQFWGEIKDWLGKFSHDKCWFSEAHDVCSHWQVEHFRPKKEAKDPDRDGYWWRAFDYLNYRLCGSVVNAKKGSFFPLKPGSKPVVRPEGNCDDEACLLIDPIRKSDVDLITFSNGGIAIPAAEVGNWDWERAEKSIKRYKLNDYPPLRRAREKVWNQCKQHVDELEVLINQHKNDEEYSPSREAEIERRRLALKEMTRSSAEFSAVARQFLLQDSRPWVRSCIA